MSICLQFRYDHKLSPDTETPKPQKQKITQTPRNETKLGKNQCDSTFTLYDAYSIVLTRKPVQIGPIDMQCWTQSFIYHYLVFTMHYL